MKGFSVSEIFFSKTKRDIDNRCTPYSGSAQVPAVSEVVFN